MQVPMAPSMNAMRSLEELQVHKGFAGDRGMAEAATKTHKDTDNFLVNMSIKHLRTK
jgi:hypothetical protein